MATPSAAPARWPAHVPHSDRALRMDLSRMAMNCQACSFLEDCDRRPALRMMWITSSGSGFSWNLRIARFVRMVSDTSMIYLVSWEGIEDCTFELVWLRDALSKA